MECFYMIVSEGAKQTTNGKFESLEEAKRAAAEASMRHLKNNGYFILKTVSYSQASVNIYNEDIE